MAHYRKIDPRMWNDEKFRTLSTEGKLAFVLLLTHPHMTALGAMRATIPGLAAELGGKGFAEAFREVFAKGLAKHDEKASCVYLPRFLKYNKPESPNVVKAWAHSIDLIPECHLKSELIQEVKGFAEALPEAFGKALPEAFAKAAELALSDARPSGDNAFKITLARKIVARALTLARDGTPKDMPALPASPFSATLGISHAG